MPGLNGTELVDRLRRDQPSIRALLVSGDPGYAAAGVGAQDYAVLPKPFGMSELVTSVREVANDS